MHFLQKDIGIPKIQMKKKADNHALFVIEPLPSGYAVTLGNTLRRLLLSSLPGAAVSGVKIHGVSHEYSAIKDIKESVLDISLNLKSLRFIKHTPETEVITLDVKKEGKITGADLKLTQNIEILNPEVVIATSNSKNAHLKMELEIQKGVGYIPASIRKKGEVATDFIAIDAIYSPVTLVKYDLEATRVGQMTNLDKLTLDIETDGSISPEDALKFASNLAQSYFRLFNEKEELVEESFMSDVKEIRAQQKEEEEPLKEQYTPIEILNFSPRTLNALINGGIGSIEQLVKCTPSKIANFRGFGKKAMDEVADALAARGLALPEDDEFNAAK